MDSAEKLDLCNRICEGARKRLDEQAKLRRKAAKKEGREPEEPPPAAYRRELRQFISKMFVEFEQRRKQLNERDAAERKRKADEAQLEAEEKRLSAKEEAAWERSRQKRVAGWRAWSGGSGRSLKRPPPVKAEAAADRDANFDGRGVDWRRDWR
mmetsp:Transcript_12378/g.32356  ORF Transcript_12378/g.32356 Transcript_12378/m.32356 type:complete len:154 (+) Transcript_12378:548-1009(+)